MNLTSSENTLITEGSLILLESNSKKRWLIKLEKKQKFHCHYGSFRHDSVIDQISYGTTIQLPRGNLHVLKPTLRDLISKYKKGTNILYEDDAAAITSLASLGCGDVALEIGTGSGGLTTYLANAVKPHGKIYTIDIDEQHTAIAKKNLEFSNFADYVKFYSGDISENPDIIPIEQFETIFVDFSSPWKIEPYISKTLVTGGQVFFFVPNASQVERIVGKYLANEYFFTDIFEIKRFNFKVNPVKNIFRPYHRQIVYTGVVLRAIKKGTFLNLKDEFS